MIWLMLTAAALLALYSLWRYGVVRNYKDWAMAICFALAVMFVLSTIARAQTLEYTEVFFGLEYPTDTHPACKQGDDQLTSNIGINQHLVTFGRTRIDATYRHHSCVIGDDDRDSDTLGLNAVWRVEW